jgi:transposase
METCPRCQSDKIVKNGLVKEKQRYKCKNCKYSFTKTSTDKKKPLAKSTANLLYVMGLSFRAIAKVVGASHVSVMNWIKSFAKKNYKKPQANGVVFLELDEMWHFIQSKKRSYGYGKPLILMAGGLLTGNVEIGMPKHFAECINA